MAPMRPVWVNRLDQGTEPFGPDWAPMLSGKLQNVSTLVVRIRRLEPTREAPNAPQGFESCGAF
jgi:hypothetical protein